MSLPPIRSLRDCAQSLLSRAHTPFSEAPSAAVILLKDGSWVPGVRIESASYSLALPALINAYTTVVAAGRSKDILALVLSRPLRREERLYLDELSIGSFESHAPDVWMRTHYAKNGALPDPTDPLPPGPKTVVDTPEEGLSQARTLTDRAYVPASKFAVGALAESTSGQLVPGVNVEHPDWARILCAERNALGTVQSYALGPIRQLFLTCPDDPEGTPCGACRQLLSELAPDADLWMDRHHEDPEHASPSTLLPGSFQGDALLNPQ